MFDVPEDLMPIAAAAKAANVPERSLFRAVEKGRIPTTKRDGVTLVALPDVLTWAERRAAAKLAVVSAGAAPAAATAGSLPAAPAMAAVVGSRYGRDPLPPADGALAAEVFDAFEAGKAPTDVVREMELPPKLVLDLYRQHKELLSAVGPKGPTLVDQLQAFSEHVAQFESFASRVDLELVSMRAALEQVFARLKGLPIPSREQFTCECGARDYHQVKVLCSCCGRESWWGFSPPQK